MSLWIANLLRRISRDLEIFNDGRNIPEDTLNAFETSIEYAYREMLYIELTQQTSALAAACDIVRNCLITVRTLQDCNHRYQYFGRPCITSNDCVVGRPSFIISINQLSFLLENMFSVPMIAEILNVSVSTVRRRMTDYGLSVRQLYSSISDQELDEIVREIQLQFPNCGNIQMKGHLLSRGIHVQQHRIRESQRRIDPDGCLLRSLRSTFQRRIYSVPSPLSLYHIDGNHKLIRYVYIYMLQCTCRINYYT